MNYASMSAMRLLEVLNDLGEQDTLEAKSLHGDPARSVLETVNSFSNEIGLGGGVILIGVSESEQADGPNYVVDGVADPDKAQLDLATQCKTVFSTAVYPTIKVEKIGKKAVLKVVVDELPHSRKPIYVARREGVPFGSSASRSANVPNRGDARGNRQCAHAHGLPARALYANSPLQQSH